jgi:hypothetical protein
MTLMRKPRPVRTRFGFRVEVRGSRQEFGAEARDVSVDGLCVSSPILLKIGDRAGASLYFRGRPAISLSCEIRWARPERSKRYLLGVEFVHTPESQKAMQALMWEIQSGQVRRDDPPAPSPFLGGTAPLGKS